MFVKHHNKIYVAVFAVILLGVIITTTWYVAPGVFETTPSEPVDNRTEIERYTDLTPEQRLEYLENETRANQNVRSYNRAKLYADQAYCDDIQNDTELKQRCIAETPQLSPGTEEPAAEPEETPQYSTADQRAYNRARLYGEASYCGDISNQDLRRTCESEV